MNKKGFTLIELLIVIAIIGLLSTLAVVALGSARVKARDSKRLADLKQIQTALELYYSENSSYPPGTSASLGTENFTCLNSAGFAAKGCTDAYMPMVPTDPTQGVFYTYTAASSTYTINATLEGVVNDMSGEIKLSPAGIEKLTP